MPFDESFGHFRIHGNRLVFTKAYFHSSVVNLDGAGSLFFDGAINFIFKIGVFSSIAKLDPTGIAHGILKRIEGELNAVEAKGTAKKVRLRLAPKTVLEALKLFEKNEPNQPDPKK